MRKLVYVLLMACAAHAQSPARFDPARGIVLRGTVVTMDDRHTVVERGNVLVRGGRIVAVWQGERPPAGTPIDDAIAIDLGGRALIFPGMVNLHDHPTYGALGIWPPPSSHAQAPVGRPLGTEPYANRYQWNVVSQTSPPEYRRLVDSPNFALTSTQALNLTAEVIKYSRVKGLVGGETTRQGARPAASTDSTVTRNVESPNFGRQRIDSFVPSIDTLAGANLSGIVSRMQNGQLDAWLVHLAEGVRNGDRRPGDTFSARDEFAVLKSKGLLTDVTAIVHGVGVERQDFAEMRAAKSPRADGSGDGLGAKLIWSPLSNLLLYGKTANVYEALAEGVTVSLGTDWSPSGSRNLLGELKIADIALRDPAILGAGRGPISDAELDRLLVDMVTRNPARTLRWQNEAGSIEAGKVADLFVITAPAPPASPYRGLIDATEQDVRLVLVDGEPLAGDAGLMLRLKPGDHEPVASRSSCYQKAIDVTREGIQKGDQSLASIRALLDEGLMALGGDHPPPGGGPADNSNTYSYLQSRATLPFPMTPAQFRDLVLVPIAGTVDGRLNLERLTLTPILTEDDDFFFDVLGGRSGTPPFLAYRRNSNFVTGGVNPFRPEAFENRWYRLPGAPASGGRRPGRCLAIPAGPPSGRSR